MQGKAERRLRESRVGPSVVVVVSTGWVVEMVELVDDFAGVWTIVIGIGRTSRVGRSKDGGGLEAWKPSLGQCAALRTD